MGGVGRSQTEGGEGGRGREFQAEEIRAVLEGTDGDRGGLGNCKWFLRG